MGHYDENRRFEDELWANGLYLLDGHQVPFLVANDVAPKESEIKMVKYEVQVPTVVYRPNILNSWTDGAKWVCDTMNAFDASKRDVDVNVINTDFAGIAEFIETYPHSTGTFYVIASHKEVAKLIMDNPLREIVHLLIR